MTNVLYGALLAAASISPAAARQPATASVWIWPLDPPVVTRPFEPPPTPYAAGHRGIDLAAVAGQPVEAAGAGVVSFAGQVAGTGVVVVRHGDLRTTYEPVEPRVTAGQVVEAGHVLGHVTGGHLGCTVCLHFGLRRGDEYLDPMLLFHRGQVRLLPVDGPLPKPLPVGPVAGPRTARMIAAAAPVRSDQPNAALAVGAGATALATVTSLAAVRSRRRRQQGS